jgi:hypothetical protein
LKSSFVKIKKPPGNDEHHFQEVNLQIKKASMSDLLRRPTFSDP